MVHVTINSRSGIHARPATLLVQRVKDYPGEVSLIKEGKAFNAKSMLSVMAMGMKCGDEIVINAKGDGEEAFEKELAAFIASIEE